MPCFLYAAVQDENKIATFAVDPFTGALAPRAEVPAQGGPSVMAISQDQRTLYAGYRGVPAISGFQIDPVSGGLTLRGTVALPHAPTFLALDRTGKYLLSAYYQGGSAAVHPLAADGTVGAQAIDWLATANGAHAIATDRSNRFAFVPHIARLNDNVLEPPRDNPGPNMILQFRFDAQTGHLTENVPFRIEPAERLGPRHYCFHPTLDVVYFSNEQGSGVTGYRLDPTAGLLSALQTISSLPDGYAERNTCSQIHITPSGRFLYVGNRGHNSIAGFSADPATGLLTPAGRVATEAVPSAFCLDPTGQFVFAAGTASGRLASYRINSETGGLTPLATYPVGQRPAALLAVETDR
ncbi:MAG: lactonase family protein [Acetobacteraceae bacterium]|nr:lactonase family protein [Acetobacteraceae bacterium]